MKTFKTYIIMALILALTSCEEVLDTVPQDKITETSFWNSTTDLELYLNSFYGNLGGYSKDSDGTSDNVVLSDKSSVLFNERTANNSSGWSWGGIRGINTFLEYAPSAAGDEADLKHFLGEGHFFRALLYFSKVRTFGDVPWYDKVLGTSDNDLLYKARDPRKDVVDHIIEDLKFAVENMKEPNEVANGRLHKYAAMHFLARVALYEGTWMKYRGLNGDAYLNLAAEYSFKVMESNKYKIVQPTSLSHSLTGYPMYYKEQFLQEDLVTNKEAILTEIFIKDTRMHNLTRQAEESKAGLSKDLIDAFLCLDGKPIANSSLYLGDDSLAMELENRDPRLRNIIDNKYHPRTTQNGALIAEPLTKISTDATKTGYMSLKYRHTDPAQWEAEQATYDKFIFRYAETLLIYAEAKAELGTISQDDLDKTVNKLRDRVSDAMTTMSHLTLSPEVDNRPVDYGYSISPLIYEIRRERRVELALEGFRFDDIVRWKAGKLIENPFTMLGIAVTADVKARYNAHFKSEVFKNSKTQALPNAKGKTQNYLRAYDDVTERKWDDKNYLNPLPPSQLSMNENLTQNPGWE